MVQRSTPLAKERRPQPDRVRPSEQDGSAIPALALQHHRRDHYKFPRMVTESPFWQHGRAVTKLCYSKRKSEAEPLDNIGRPGC